MIFPCLLTSTGSVSRRTTFSSILLSFLKAMPVIVPMKMKKTITVGINWRSAINAPMMMKIQRVIPCSMKVIDLANAGVIRVINPIINPTIDPISVSFNYYLLSFVLNLNECISSQFWCRHKKTHKEAVLSSLRVFLASNKDSWQLGLVSLCRISW